MKFISRKAHAVLDYSMSIILIAAPWLFSFSDIAPAKWTVIAIGLATILMSLITNYEGGVVKILPMGAHLTIDVVISVFLAVSPWYLGFSEQVSLPHVILGIIGVIAGICTRTTLQGAAKGSSFARPNFWYR